MSTVPFIPQTNITENILGFLHQASQDHDAAIEQQQRNSQLSIAQQEANQSAARLGIEAPEISARTALYNAQVGAAKTESQIQAQKLVHDQWATNYLNGVSGSASPAHMDTIVGDHHQPGVPLVPQTQALDISNPMGATLSAPTAPGATPQAQPEAGEQGPTAPATPAGINSDIAELDRRIGLVEPEKQQIASLLQMARVNQNPTDGLSHIYQGLQDIVAKRNDPQWSTEVSLLKQGYSAPAAFELAKRNTEFSAELTKIEQQPESLAGDKASVAKAQLQAAAQNPENTNQNRARAQRLAQVAQVAETNQLNAKANQARAEQAAKDGDPNAAAQLLVSGQVAPSQLISARNAEFATRAFSAASKLDKTWNAQKAQADFKASESPSNLSFFGPAHSMIDKDGTLDQLAAAARDIPGGKIPVFNKLADATKAAAGNGPIAKYAAIALGVADDYSKITGGGGSDSAREQALHLLPADASPAARAASLQGIRGTVESQINSRIGNNRVLKAQYGIDSTSATSSDPKTQGGLSSAASSYLQGIGVAH